MEPISIEIQHPEVWNLSARISADGITYAMHSTMDEGTLTYGQIAFDIPDQAVHKQLEAAIYDNRFFLYDYGKRRFLIDSTRFVIVPEEFTAADNARAEQFFRSLYPNDKAVIAVDRLPEVGADITYAIEPAIDSFLRRTFDNPPTQHVLTPIIKFLRQKDIYGAERKMYAYVTDRCLEIVALRNGRLIFGNRYDFSTETDALYYIINVWRTLEMSDADELHIMGDKERKKALLPELRKYVKTVIQTIFPAQLLKLGKNAMTAPFDLIVMPLCE
ncbi:MAG: DUF3822 family protein [Candidatus Limisoma sp.]